MATFSSVFVTLSYIEPYILHNCDLYQSVSFSALCNRCPPWTIFCFYFVNLYKIYLGVQSPMPHIFCRRIELCCTQFSIHVQLWKIYLWNCSPQVEIFKSFIWGRGEAAKLAHLMESASLKRNYMTKNYEKIFI